MTDYRTINPILIDSVACDDSAELTKILMFFGSLEPADLYFDTELVARAGIPVSHGYVRSPIPNPLWPGVFSPDASLSINCTVLYGLPTSCTETEFLQGKNVAYIGRAGQWEAIYYRDVANNSDGTITLSRILRGVKGTWVQGNAHAIKDTIVFGNTGLVRFTRPLTALGTTVTTKIVPAGADRSIKTGLGGPLQIRATTLAPWAPVNPHASRLSGDDAISWTRVDRAPSTMHDGDDATPLTDAPERYSLGVFKAPWYVGDPPIRQVVGLTTPAWTYTAAMRATDGLSAATSYTLLICQDSTLVGHGIPFFGVVNVE